MKRPEYVAAAVSACRRAADGEPIPPRLLENLEAVFSRSGFTSGFFDAPGRGRTRALFGTRREETPPPRPGPSSASCTSSPARNTRASRYAWRSTRAPGAAHAHRRRRGGLFPPPSPAILPSPRAPVPPIRSAAPPSSEKTGGTPFFAEAVECRIGEGLSFPVSALNRLRREALDALMEKKSGQARRPVHPRAVRRAAPPPRGRASAAARPLPLGPAAGGGPALRAVLCPVGHAPRRAAPPARRRLFPRRGAAARPLSGLEEEAKRRLTLAREAGVTRCWAGNLGAARLARECGFYRARRLR